MIKFTGHSARPQVNILASHHFTSFAVKLPKDSKLAVASVDPYDGKTKKRILAGTVYPSNDAKAEGIILNDYDVTYGDTNAAIVTHGVIKTCMLPEAITPEAMAALKHIQFRDRVDVGIKGEIVCPKLDKLKVNAESEFAAVLVLNNASFLPLAEVPENWAIGVPGSAIGKIVESKLLTDKLISIRIQGVIDKAGNITLQPNAKVTTYKNTIEPAIVAIVE